MNREAEVTARALAQHEQRLEKMRPPLELFRDKHAGQTALILGNGPSLLDHDPATIPADVVTIGLNGSWRVYDDPTYHICVDDGPHYRGLSVKPEHLAMVPTAKMDRIKHTGGGQWWFDEAAAKGKLICTPAWPIGIHLSFALPARLPERFSHDPAAVGVLVSIDGCGSVMYVALQLAMFMGFSMVYLVGFDQTNQKFTGQSAAADSQHRLFRCTPEWVRKRVRAIRPSATKVFEVVSWPW